MARRRVMVRHQGTVLVDTNVILEAHRTESWQALSGGYHVETVKECVDETQKGHQNREPEQQIDEPELRNSLEAVHADDEKEYADLVQEAADLVLKADDIALDGGEAFLLAHALTREDDWVLCGPDVANMRCAVRFGFCERFVSLERLLDGVGHRPRVPLKKWYTQKWQREKFAELVLLEEARKNVCKIGV